MLFTITTGDNDMLIHRLAKILFLALALPLAATAQEFKNPIRLIVPFAPGGGTDVVARTIAPRISKVLNQTVFIENRGGASGQIGVRVVKNAPPDGSVFLFTPDHSLIVAPLLMDNAGYEPSDFIAVGQATRFQWAMAASTVSGAKSLTELVDYVRKDPLRGNYGVPLVGGMPAVIGTAVEKKAGLNMTAVAYNGSAPMATDLAGGTLAAGIAGLQDIITLHQSGRFRIVAVSGVGRSTILPDVPTFDEMGYRGLTVNNWYAFFAPKGLPQPLAIRFNQAVNAALADPEVKRKIADMSMELAPTTLEQAEQEFRNTVNFWTDAAKSPDFVRP
jgi:tripartite-type tricarboxylate transporter receptor subunit TctC